MNIRRVRFLVIALALAAGYAAIAAVGRFSLDNHPKGLLVVAVAHEWWWEFNYPSLGIAHSQELHLPVGTPIHFELKSGDAFHSFWLPGLKHSVAIVPDRPSELNLRLLSTGRFYGNCDAGCGCGSVCMRFPVVAESPAGFRQWVIASRSAKSSISRPSGQLAPPCAFGDSDQNGLTPAAERLARLLEGRFAVPEVR
jgi:heme/copper-type cytochrome/quinol oxidase subunit 2